MEELKTLGCLRCGHTWTPRTVNPRKCPRCLSPLWNVPRSVDKVLNEVLTQKMAANAELRTTRVAGSSEHRLKKRDYMRDNYTTKDGKHVKTPGKRAHTGVCELCGRELLLQYHHWDDLLLSMGLWLCPPCHQFAEGVDHGLLSKYLKIKQGVEKQFMVSIGRTGSTKSK